MFLVENGITKPLKSPFKDNRDEVIKVMDTRLEGKESVQEGDRQNVPTAFR